jgi:hypothetical protein
MLNNARLLLEFWDEAITADIYLRNRTNTGPIIDGKTTSPEGAWTGVTPSIDHIRVRGSKCYSYINPKTIPIGQRHDKFVNTGKIGVFVGYTGTTKQLRVYSPELGYTFRSSKVLVDEKVKGGSIDPQLRNCVSGPQGILNLIPDHKPRGRPRKEITEITQSAPISPAPALPQDESILQVATPVFIPIPDVPQFTQNDTLGKDNIANLENTPSLEVLVSPNHSGKLETQSELPSILVPIVTKPQDPSELDNLEPEEAVSNQLESLSPQQEDAPRYFTRSVEFRIVCIKHRPVICGSRLRYGQCGIRIASNGADGMKGITAWEETVVFIIILFLCFSTPFSLY